MGIKLSAFNSNTFGKRNKVNELESLADLYSDVIHGQTEIVQYLLFKMDETFVVGIVFFLHFMFQI